MPTVEWNKIWSRQLNKFNKRNPNRQYGLQWGNPEWRGAYYRFRKILNPVCVIGPLYKVVDDYIRPNYDSDSVVLEIGCGGGRWTKYLLGAKKIIAVDLNPEFFDYIKEKYPDANFEFYKPQGCDLKAIPDSSVDFVFSFGTFVHIDPDGIQSYLNEISRVLKKGKKAVIHYADKNKLFAKLNPTFSKMTAEKMEGMVPLPLVGHDTRLLSHSSIIILQK